MKMLPFFTLLLAFSLSLQAQTGTTIPEAKMNELVAEHNLAQPGHSSIGKAFQAEGIINASGVVEDERGERWLVINFTNQTQREGNAHYRFSFGLLDELDYRLNLKNVRLLFLGNHLYLEDKDSDYRINLMVSSQKSDVNRLQQLPPVQGIGLGIQTLREDELKVIALD